MTKTNRSATVDIAKGLAMLCIIAGHLGRPEVKAVVFTFDVPVFFIIAGYFFRPAEQGFAGIARRAKRLLVPCVTCGIACALGAGIRTCLQGAPQDSWTAARDCFVQALYGSGTLASPILGIPSFGATWFLLALFWSLVAYDWLCGKRWATPAVLCVFAVGLVTRDWWLPFSVQAGMCALLFVHVGWLARNKLQLRIDKMPLSLILVSVMVWIIAYLLDQGRFYLVQNYFTNVPVDVAGGIAGSVLLVTIARYVEKVPLLSSGLAAFGKDSLAVMCLHMFEMRVIPWSSLVAPLGLSAITGDYWGWFIFFFVVKVLWATIGLLVLRLLRRMISGVAPEEDATESQTSFCDAAKGVAIVLIVVGSQVDMDPVVRTLIYSFHIPLFFMVNAVCVQRPHDVRLTLMHLLHSLLVPYAVACLLEAGLRALVTPIETKAAVIASLKAALWGDVSAVFDMGLVVGLLVACVVYVLIRQLTTGAPEWVPPAVVTILAMVGCWLGKRGLWLPWGMDVALAAQPFMYMGDEVLKQGGALRRVPAQAAYACVAVWAALTLSGYQIDMELRAYPGWLLCIAAACLGSLLAMAGTRRLTRGEGAGEPYTGRILGWMGRGCMVILTVHSLRMGWSLWTTGSASFCAEYDWLLNGCFEVALCGATLFTWERVRKYLVAVPKLVPDVRGNQRA